MRRNIARTLTCCVFGIAVSAPAFAQDNLEKLSGFKTTGVTDFEYIEQGGDYAAQLRGRFERG